MVARMNKYRSVNLTRFYMKIVGFWKAKSKSEQRLMNIALSYTLVAVIFGIGVQVIDFYFSFGDFYAITYNLCITMLIVMILVKLSSFMYYRDLVMKIITYAENNFWEIEYGEYGDEVIRACDRKGVIFICSFTMIVQICACNFLIAPLIENRGRNGTDRLLPFRIWFDLPTPYYEITYAIQGLSTIHSGICTFCFDNFMCCFNIYVAGQFKILGHKFESIFEEYLKNLEKNEDSNNTSKAVYTVFVDCVHEHVDLIKYVEYIETVFTWILFGQLLLSSILICFGGFQILTATGFIRKFIFILHFVGGVSQLFIYTLTCNDVTHQSEKISNCAYNMIWYLLPHDENGKSIKHGILMVMNRVRHPCIFKAAKFSPMSLQTFRSLLSTAASYFTLLRQLSVDGA